MKKAIFVDANGMPIRNGSCIYFLGTFPKSMPKWSLNGHDIRQFRKGIALIRNNELLFALRSNGTLITTGLTWEQDGEPCYDLRVISTPRHNKIIK